MRKFSTVLKQLREERNMSQRELAEKLKLSNSSIGMYESEKRKPSFEVLEAVADYFNVDLDYLYGKTLVRNSSKELDDIDLSKEHFMVLGKDTEDLTADELKEVAEFIRFVRSKR